MNRVEKRQYIRNIKSRKGLKKKHAKGAFGRPPQVVMEERERKIKQKIEKTMYEELAKIPENEPKTAENCQKVTVSDKKEAK